MKIGIMGGMSDFAVEFYLKMLDRLMIKLEVRSAEFVTHEKTERRIGQLARAGCWDDVVSEMVKAARVMQRAGAEFVVIPSFSLHRVADAVAKESGVSILRMDDCVVEAAAKMDYQKVAVLSSAKVSGEEFTEEFCNKLVNSKGCKMRDYGGLAAIEFSPITLGNQPWSKKLRRAYLWTYVEELANVEGCVEVIFNCSVEMTRIIGSRAAQMPTGRDGSIPIFNAVDLHGEAIVRACLGTRSQ